MRPRHLRKLLISCGVAIGVMGSSLMSWSPLSPTETQARVPPNIVLIVTDDQRWDTLTTEFMPKLMQHLVAGRDAAFLDQAFITDPVCCPSRVSILTGSYASTTGVFGNYGRFTGMGGTGGGGYNAFNDDPSVNPTIAVDLHAIGYRTMLVGKYLNGYHPTSMYRDVPPGWDRWFATDGGVYYDYAAATGRRVRRFGHRLQDYSSHVFVDESMRFVSGSEAAGRPFFLYLAPSAPHAPADALPRDRGRFTGAVARYQDPISVGRPVVDAPPLDRGLPWNPRVRARIDRFHARQLDSLYSLDRELSRLWAALPTNTVVLFTSDNGMLWGEHRRHGKGVAFDESIRVPMVIATKGLGMPTAPSDRMSLNIDIRATLEGYAGLSPATDGEVLTDPTWTRRSFPIEDWEAFRGQTYCGVRSVNFLYGRFRSGAEELYDLRADPLEMQNIASTDTVTLHHMRARARSLCTQGNIYPPHWPF